MQTKKMSLANIKGKLSRIEMKNIMAGNVTNPHKCCIGTECTGCSTSNQSCEGKAVLTNCTSN